jgi:hypothetical protein
MNRNLYRRIHDGAPVTEDEALDAFGVLKSGYGQWVALPLMMKDAAPGSQSVILSDSDIAYEQMKIWDANAWRTRAAKPLRRWLIAPSLSNWATLPPSISA